MLEVDIRKNIGSFNLEVAFTAQNETLGFLGASGCGKSLTLRCIAGIEKPDEGKIIVNGTTFFDKARNARAKKDLTPQQRKTALLFQNYMLFPHLTVEENIISGIDKNNSRNDKKRIAEEQLTRFGLLGMEKRYPVQLSGGQQQRVALARMLAAHSGILMLDEPFSALDAHLKSSLEQNLIGLFKDFEGTILYVSHDIDEAFRFCDRIAVVDTGKISEIGPKKEIVENPSSLAAIKLSGCKNTTPAEYRDDHTLFLPEWGITLYSETAVPQNLKWFGVRAFYLRRVTQKSINTFRMRADRVSDSRFERTVMLSFLDTCDNKNTQEQDTTMKFFKYHLQWKVNKLSTAEKDLPQEGDELFIEIPPQAMYLVTR